jgi:hypothetical protein
VLTPDECSDGNYEIDGPVTKGLPLWQLPHNHASTGDHHASQLSVVSCPRNRRSHHSNKSAVPRTGSGFFVPARGGTTAGPPRSFIHSLVLAGTRQMVLHQAAGQLPTHSLVRAYISQDNAISVVVTVIAPPILVAMEAKGISCMRFAAVKIATSPVPPWPL